MDRWDSLLELLRQTRGIFGVEQSRVYMYNRRVLKGYVAAKPLKRAASRRCPLGFEYVESHRRDLGTG